MNRFLAVAALAALTPLYALAEELPCTGTPLAGTVHDSTQALIPGAEISLDEDKTASTPVLSGPDGHFRLACVTAGLHHLTITSPGFDSLVMPISTPHVAALDLTLKLGSVETELTVDANDDSPANSPNSTGTSQTISGKLLQSLADDPDDLLLQLQQLAAAAGGNPANTTISVDGFQDSTSLPPKNSIAYIKINPDQFSAEYREPPFEGGRVEVYTKPGQKTFHGALFTTNSSSWMNARDPFSVSESSIGKQRYGFELSGPVRPHVRNGEGSDFSLNLEHRSIDNVAVIDATTLDSLGNQTSFSSTVPDPQRLWIGLARVDWQLSPKNTFIVSYNANVSHLANVGVGGTTLAEAGYDSGKYDHTVRFSDVTTISAHLMHEARVSLRFDGETDVPNSSAPQVQVSGAFTGGGASIGQQRLKDFAIEYDDDAILTTKKHTLKIGSQLFTYSDRQVLTTNFNGAYTYASLAAYASNAPTTYTAVTGSPTVTFLQAREALYIQDDWNPGHGFHISGGVRYYLQNDPTVLNSATPRLGILWSPNKKGTWTLHAHSGIFAGQFGRGDIAEILREDGTTRVTSTVYNPIVGSPFSGSPTIIHSERQFSPHLTNQFWSAQNIGGTRALPKGFNFSTDFYEGRFWNAVRSNNINAPLSGGPTGPRPITPNLNILQLQSSAQGRVNAVFAGIEQHSFKRAQFLFGGVRVNIIDDNDDSDLSTPQNAYSDAGEFAHRTGQPVWNIFGNGSFTFPEKLQLSVSFNGQGDSHYNITTGNDNNGDGQFNDRPQYAAPGTPGAIQTRYGLLTNTGGIGVLQRNLGVLPWSFFLDLNLQRTFALTHNAKANHPQSLTVNLRSQNALNHTNVTSVGGVLGSSLFGVPYAASNGRRIEAGLRYSF